MYKLWLHMDNDYPTGSINGTFTKILIIKRLYRLHEAKLLKETGSKILLLVK